MNLVIGLQEYNTSKRLSYQSIPLITVFISEW
nr:MAG TPA: hypothetical protein [Caudoviricetes sp.]DAO19402.1 MAG TPA: hypothetical protein [Caudoviricetes sp.]DAR75043.1 MAG TPA: hypothetical protein [Caudoviricetes sp.]